MTDLEHDARIRREAILEALEEVAATIATDSNSYPLTAATWKRLERGLRALADSPPPASGGAIPIFINTNVGGAGVEGHAAGAAHPTNADTEPMRIGPVSDVEALRAESGAPPSTAVAAGGQIEALQAAQSTLRAVLSAHEKEPFREHRDPAQRFQNDIRNTLGVVNAALAAAPTRADSPPTPGGTGNADPNDTSGTEFVIQQASPPIPPSEPRAWRVREWGSTSRHLWGVVSDEGPESWWPDEAAATARVAALAARSGEGALMEAAEYVHRVLDRLKAAASTSKLGFNSPYNGASHAADAIEGGLRALADSPPPASGGAPKGGDSYATSSELPMPGVREDKGTHAAPGAAHPTNADSGLGLADRGASADTTAQGRSESSGDSAGEPTLWSLLGAADAVLALLPKQALGATVTTRDHEGAETKMLLGHMASNVRVAIAKFLSTASWGTVAPSGPTPQPPGPANSDGPGPAAPSTAVAAGDLLQRVSDAIRNLSVADSQWRRDKGHIYSFNTMLDAAWANFGRIQVEIDQALAAPTRADSRVLMSDMHEGFDDAPGGPGRGPSADDSPPACEHEWGESERGATCKRCGFAVVTVPPTAEDIAWAQRELEASPPIPPSEPRVSGAALYMLEETVRDGGRRENRVDRRAVSDNDILDVIADLRNARAALAARSGEGDRARMQAALEACEPWAHVGHSGGRMHRNPLGENHAPDCPGCMAERVLDAARADRKEPQP